METFVHGMPGESTGTVICEKLPARAQGNENLPATSRSLYRDRVIKKMNQATGITPQHTFRENRSLLTRVTTRIASLLSFDTSTTQLSEVSARCPAAKASNCWYLHEKFRNHLNILLHLIQCALLSFTKRLFWLLGVICSVPLDLNVHITAKSKPMAWRTDREWMRYLHT